MNVARISKKLLIAGVAAVCACGIVACSGDKTAEVLKGVAATVNGTEITEQQVADKITQQRGQSGMKDDEAWGKFLVAQGETAADIRDETIDDLVEIALIQQGAAELGLSVEDSDVDESIETLKSNYEDDEAWNDALDAVGFTEDTYREAVKEGLLERAVVAHFREEAEDQVTDEDRVSAANTYATYYDGAKRSSQILFGVDDTSDEEAMATAEAQATEVLARINSGELDFTDAVNEYSTDDASKENGGDVGWDKLESFVTEYTTALADLELDQISEPVSSEYGVHLIKVTEVFNAPEEVTSWDEIPEAFQENIEDMAISIKANTLYTDWLDNLKDNADIVKNDMPEGLPYDIDLTKYQEEADAAAAEEESTDDTTTTDDSTVVTDDSTITLDDTATTDTETTETSTTSETTEAATTEIVEDTGAAEGEAVEGEAQGE